MKLIIQRSDIKGVVNAPPSKSYTHRAIAIAALSKKASVNNPLISEDTKATIRALEAFGASIDSKSKKDTLIINGFEGKPKTPGNVIDVANSGTTLRIMTAVASLADGATVLTGDASIRIRPNTPLLNALNDLGAEAFSTRNNGMAPIVIRGKMRGGRIYIDGSISSQFISALLISCPFARNETSILIKGELKSRPYVNITVRMLQDAGARIIADGLNSFIIPPEQECNMRSYNVPGDFSSASYMMAAGALCGEMVIKNLFPSEQGDAALIEILRRMGAQIQWDEKRGEVKVSKSRLKGISVDVGKTPDLVPTLAVLGAASEGTMVIENAEHVRYKETDRLHAMTVELKKMGVDITEEKDRLIIKGGSIKGAEVHGWDDHRIVMALAVAGMVAGDTTIDTVESVSISYPGFFEDLRKIGAGVS
ncbi:3-phosphoshikimate 1-carboxyvinyltransferase [Candidatus Methanoperedens nitroreducens]|uniref:3-phosphoshikimate 1-carboxyvinyltransferase n=1 Tax=Candidatus Methanoperedens nitratireducens TaxID=1392998 RepID=A0A062UTP9_9EURY|nr:3-phosphoshikimate 1-carboxyvinyltransferase [Candidatus Methanoperedens nitroreducens]KCZ70411.1 3-phosphoshikimate 1-carboxyvinyltransferase [Candidatus Methanoperedens nitroreducens]MDJ1420849.1 3-phosphoshikimate 1-carboxyvinyltransferase [Candidatus Methanoperedens sp.]